MTDCGCTTHTETAEQRRTLKLALGLNATMFIVEVVAGILGHSSGLLADGLDMLADASAYAVALVAVTRGPQFKSSTVMSSGALLFILGVGVLLDVVRRVVGGEAPEGLVMIAVAVVALAVNVTVSKLLGRHRDDGVHWRETWILTRADVVANIAVILSGIAVLATGFRYIDLMVGAAIGLYVIRESVEILGKARRSRAAS